MRILVFQQAAWDDTNAVGNTLSNWFSDWKEDVFANFYTRKQVPNNSIVSTYYSISAVDVVKGLIRRKKIAKSFKADQVEMLSIEDEHAREQKSIDRLHRSNNELIYWTMEQVWRSRIWIDRYFKDFIREFNPDVFFAFCASIYILDPLIQYIKSNTNAKIVLFVADDVYGDYSRKSIIRKGYLVKSLYRCIANSDLLYGISEQLCDYYKTIFNREFKPLYKGCKINEIIKSKASNHPLKIVYAGNLYYGREETLKIIAESLSRINHNGVKARLEIYTGSTLTDELLNKLNVGESSTIMGKRSYGEIKQILSEADIVLHVESFEKEQIDYVKYSFSTKITDCLESGNLIWGIGPSGIASIEYLKKIKGVMVTDSIEKIEIDARTLLNLTEDEIRDRVLKTYEFAAKHHEIEIIRQNLRSDFTSVCSVE